MKILITGVNGQLGHDCRTVLEPNHNVCGVDLPDIDITDNRSISANFDAFLPEVVINCAAYTQVDECEKVQELAMRVNGDAPGMLAQACSETGARFIHISTDYVFSGDRTPPAAYTEGDTPSPIGSYGSSKLAGEISAAAACEQCAILRTAWLYGRNGHNFPKTMLRLALASPERTIRVVDDQYGSPTWSFRLAEQISNLLNDFAPGIYHATAENHCNWHEFAQRFLNSMDIPYNLAPCSSSEYPTPAKRPVNSILENSHLKARKLNTMRDWSEDVILFARQHRDELLHEAGASNP